MERVLSLRHFGALPPRGFPHALGVAVPDEDQQGLSGVPSAVVEAQRQTVVVQSAWGGFGRQEECLSFSFMTVVVIVVIVRPFVVAHPRARVRTKD